MKKLWFQDQVVAVTGASGTLGQALIRQLYLQGAQPIALTSQVDPVQLEIADKCIAIRTFHWQVGQEAALASELAQVDILILNHGINVHGERSPQAIQKSYEINALSSWRLLELFLQQVTTQSTSSTKEIWVNTSEAEVNPALSPLYELSKRTLGDLVTLRRLDSPCTIRKLILGPFKSQLNPVGIMSAEWVAQQILRLAHVGWRNIIVTINPLTYLLFPLKESAQSLYFKWFTRA